jgi:superkiller protein 3
MASARRLAPERVEVVYDHAWALIASARFLEALESLDAVLAKCPTFAAGHYHRGCVLQQLGRHEEAIDAFDRAMTLDPSDGRVHLDRAISLEHVGKAHEALQSYERARRHNPDEPLAAINVGLLRSEGGDRTGSIEAFERAYELQPDVGNALNLADALAEANRLEDAERILTTELKRSGHAFELRIELAKVFLETGRTEAALELLRSVIAEHPTDGTALAVLSGTLLHAGFKQQALDTSERLVDLYPDIAEARGTRGWVFLRFGDAAAALREFDAAAQLDPNNMMVVGHRGVALSGLGRHDEAIHALEMVKMSEPALLSAHPELRASLELSKRGAGQ